MGLHLHEIETRPSFVDAVISQASYKLANPFYHPLSFFHLLYYFHFFFCLNRQECVRVRAISSQMVSLVTIEKPVRWQIDFTWIQLLRLAPKVPPLNEREIREQNVKLSRKGISLFHLVIVKCMRRLWDWFSDYFIGLTSGPCVVHLGSTGKPCYLINSRRWVFFGFIFPF